MRHTPKSIALCLLLTASFAQAGGTQTGLVTSIHVRAQDGLISFYMDGTASGRATCAANQPYWIIKDETSNSGKQQLSILMTAKATGKTISVTGLGTCTRWGDGEDVNDVAINP